MTPLPSISAALQRRRPCRNLGWAVGAVLGAVFALSGCVTPPPRDQGPFTPPETINPGVPWPATDALGRALPVGSVDAKTRPNRAVGVFYFLTHEANRSEPAKNLAEILARDPDVLRKPNSPLWGPPAEPYYWGEPLFGYYASADPWVLRRHAMLLADAGVDTVIFDTTNRRTYRDVYLKLLEVWTQIRREGGRTPQVCFMVNTKAGQAAQELFHDLYQPDLYADLWFRWKGRPLLLCDPKDATPEVAAFFTLRKAHWPFTLVNTHNEWHWESTYPQVYSYDEDPAQPEQVNVAVAQNLRAADGKVTNMSERNARGRSFHQGKAETSAGAVNHGYNFAEQWQRAIELDPPFVMVTGWNEWTAGKFRRPNQPVVFVDQFDEEYSRDIEPVKGLHGDNYYYQLVDGIRRYKGAPPVPAAGGEHLIDLNGEFTQWRDVTPEFADHRFDTEPRDFGRGARHYVNRTGRNDLVLAKVARDDARIYFYLQTRTTIDARAGLPWLLLDTDQNHATGWEGYDWIVNRDAASGEFWLERNAGGWNWERVAWVQLRVEGNELMIAVPRTALHLSKPLRFDFKWWDNPQKPGDIMDAYVSGDVAPEGRFNFRYQSAAPPRAATQ